ncbi:MAG: hypothetical protein M3Z02_12160 [Actinomycetota bacterium]|nr:hypothetical protein [Actinomycetota bacterium]
MADRYAHVPPVDGSACVDDAWLRSRAGSLLPPAYMPPAMGGAHPGWMRIAAWTLIAIFLTATTSGICLTYGPGL